MRILLRALSIAAPAMALACSSSNAGPGASDAGGENESGLVSCGAPTDTYVANLAKPGTQGKYTFTLARAVPAPPALNGNVWTVKILDKSGASPSLAQVTAYPFMPLMGHPSDQSAQLAANGDGTFTISNIYLFMPGLWTITLSVTTAPAASDGGVAKPPARVDEAVFTFCVG